MNLIPTELNQRLANAVRYSGDSDRFYIGGKVAFWRLVGVGVFMFAIGTMIGVSCYGYSYVSGNTDTFESLSSSLSKALAEVQLKATAQGTVQIEPRQIALAQNQSVSLDSNSRVLLDPSAQIRADGEIKVQGPTFSTSTPRTGPNRSQAPLPTNIVNFTVFKGVPFAKGTVQTGWVFLTSAQRFPTSQYCYYTEKSETPGRNITLDIAVDEKFDPPKIRPDNFDLADAFSKCIWFKGDAQ